MISNLTKTMNPLLVLSHRFKCALWDMILFSICLESLWNIFFLHVFSFIALWNISSFPIDFVTIQALNESNQFLFISLLSFKNWFNLHRYHSLKIYTIGKAMDYKISFSEIHTALMRLSTSKARKNCFRLRNFVIKSNVNW